jgi:hypothetical protein
MPQPLLPQFSPELESDFQRDYYSRIRPGLRFVALSLAALIPIHTVLFAQAPAPFLGAAAEISHLAERQVSHGVCCRVPSRVPHRCERFS